MDHTYLEDFVVGAVLGLFITPFFPLMILFGVPEYFAFHLFMAIPTVSGLVFMVVENAPVDEDGDGS